MSAKDTLRSNVKRQRMDDCYPMNSQPVGLCLIINNVKFKKPRYGSDEDAKSLAEVFSWLGFRVLMCKDQTKDRMERTLTWFASLTDPDQLQGIDVEEWSGSKFTKSQPILNHGDAFICCVLSHGDKGVVKGVDSKPISINEITGIFKATEQSALTGKPKVFLIQACQGEADFLLAISTVEDYKSVRRKKDGSWFVQSVCRQLKEHCPSGEDLLIILHHVNNEVSQRDRLKKKPGEGKQMPEVRFTLTKGLVFSPRHN